MQAVAAAPGRGGGHGHNRMKSGRWYARLFVCPWCGEVFFRYADVLQHIDGFHRDQQAAALGPANYPVEAMV
jgi:hypothetical protein